jgi:hypothetical protein
LCHQNILLTARSNKPFFRQNMVALPVSTTIPPHPFHGHTYEKSENTTLRIARFWASAAKQLRTALL